MKKIVLVLVLVTTMCFTAWSAGKNESMEGTTIIFGDISWDSIQVHNRIAAFIIENGYEGYKVDFMPGDTLPIVNGILQGDIDVNMESWHGNFLEVYEKGITSGILIDLGENMPDAPQGWYIHR